jgi:hypothetical protein
VRLTRDHLAASGAVTATGQLLVRTQDRPVRGPDVVRFLQHLLDHVPDVPGKVLVLWDGAPIHRAQPVKDFLAAGAARRLWLEPLPGYAPDCNPLDQGVWQHLKHVELANVCGATLNHLRNALRQAIARLRHKPRILLGCIRHAGYHL